MSRKKLNKQYAILTAKIRSISDKEMDLCYLSANGQKCGNEMMQLMLVRHDLENLRASVIRQLNKPTIITKIRRIVKK